MLRHRIFTGVIPLVILLMTVGGYAVWLFFRLGNAVNTTLHENYVSIVAMRDLKDAAERIERALSDERAAPSHDTPDQIRAFVEEQATICRRNVDAEFAIITEPGEREAAERLRARDEAFLQAVSSGAASGKDKEEDFHRRLNDLLDAAVDVRGINERAMTSKDRHARDLARQSTRVMLLAMAAALPVGLFFAYRLSGIILRPIQRLTESARDLGEGNLDQVLPTPSRDELGQLAAAFNKMAGKLRLYRQTTTDELVQARQATEIVFAALLDPILIFSADGQIAYQNPAAERLRKKLAETDLTLPVASLAMKVLQGGSDYLPESFEQSICVRVDEREKFLLPRVIGLGEGGAGAVAILHDVTRFRLLDDVKTNLVATVSHELKTPLTSIRMAVYLLLEERIGALNAKQTELVIASRDDAERLLELINNLLDLARMESGKSVSERRAQRPEKLVRDAANEARELVIAAGATITTQLAVGLPPVVVSADQLGHVFSNLISNAAKHSPPGEEIAVATQAVDDGRAVRFSVTDYGTGVPPAERERVFEKFYRLPGEPREGAGLGLAICREIVRAHNGEIGVTEGPGGRGSEFFFVLPANTPAISANPSRR